MIEEIKKIYQTCDYALFEFMKGNRKINQKKLSRMIKEMKESCPFTLIRVTSRKGANKKYQISDGQHTYLALKTLSKPINFFVCNNETIDEVRSINTNMDNWSIWDYVESYSSTGNKEYIKIIQLQQRYAHFRQKELFVNLALGKYTKMRTWEGKEVIKNGKFIFKDYYPVVKILDQLSDYSIIEGIRYTNYLFLRAALYLIICDKYDHDRMISQLRKYPSITRKMDIDGYLEELLRKYNYRMLTGPKIYFHEVK